MLKPKSVWKINDFNKDEAARLAKEVNVPPVIGQLLIARGLTTPEAAKRFLDKDHETFNDPFLLDGMHEALERIHKAIRLEEKIVVYGDYDADGVSATSILTKGLREAGALADFYVPDRFREGYGPNIQALDKIKADEAKLVITVDTGISAIAEAEHAAEIGLDYIVTDHHEPPPALPEAALAIINPKKPGCPYPFKSLAGAGVALKLVHALRGELPKHLLDIAAVGTISDMVSLTGENRLIAMLGLELINQSPKPGLKALLSVSGLEGKVITSDHVGFSIGPRINAAGRLYHAAPAIELFLTEDREAAAGLASDLDQANDERKQIVDKMTEQAVAKVEAKSHMPSVIVVADKDWHAGVIGICASRLVEKFYRPVIVFAIDEKTGIAKGSARSITGFDIFRALSEFRSLLPHLAVTQWRRGMSCRRRNLNELDRVLNAYASNILTDEDINTNDKSRCYASHQRYFPFCY